MPLKLGDTVPDFTAETTEGTISFHDYIGNGWCILFSHPADYTPVCTTELGTVAKLRADFEKRNVKPIGVSVDPLDSHKGWINDINETQNTVALTRAIADARQYKLAFDLAQRFLGTMQEALSKNSSSAT